MTSRSPDTSAGRLTEALTFDDVLLAPGHAEVHPSDVDVSAQLTRDIRLAIPLMSAAMDTVTELEMGIALAREGGIGIIHKNMSIEAQVQHVDRVKRSESGMILDPITLGPDATLGEARRHMIDYRISGVPVVNGEGHLIGILTNRDLIFETDPSRPVRDVMTSEGLVTAPLGTSLDDAEEILRRHKIEKLPVVDDEGRLEGLITVKDIFKRRQFPNATKDDRGRLRVGAAVGAGPRDPGASSRVGRDRGRRARCRYGSRSCAGGARGGLACS